MSLRRFILSLTACGGAMLASCQQPLSTSAAADITTVRAAFDAPVTGRPGKEAWFEREGHVIAALAKDPSQCDAAIAYLRSKPPDDANFAGTLECSLLNALVYRNDTKRLTALLSTLPIEVDNPDGNYIEYALLDPYSDKPRIEGLYVLFDAYALAEDREVRANLARAVRRAFHYALDPLRTDDEVMDIGRGFVDKFTKCKLCYKPNREYDFAYSPGLFDVGNCTPPRLIIPHYWPDRVAGGQEPPQ